MTLNTTTTTISAPAAPSEQDNAPRTGAFRFSRDEWLAIRAAWKIVAHAKKATAAQHAVYTLLRGASLDRAFTDIRNTNKIASSANNPKYHRDMAVRSATRGVLEAYGPWAHLLDKLPKNRSGWAYEGAHPILDAVRESAAAAEAPRPSVRKP